MLAVAFSGEVPLLAAYTQIFMPALGKFLAKYFPLFLLGAVFGKLMEESGCAQAIANRISSHAGQPPRDFGGRVVRRDVDLRRRLAVCRGFAILPLASSVFQNADIPRRLIPGAIALVRAPLR